MQARIRGGALPLLLAGALVAGVTGCSKQEASKQKASKQEDDKAAPMPGHDLGDEARALIFDSPVHTIEGKPTSLGAEEKEGKALLIVNVASECGFTPQYEGLQHLQETYADRGFSVVGFPCNQFNQQEPGTPDEILAFGKENYGVTFPLFEKIEVNGDGRHPIYRGLTRYADGEGKAGDVGWNFEKFVISADRKRIARFRSETTPDDPSLVAAVEAALP